MRGARVAAAAWVLAGGLAAAAAGQTLPAPAAPVELFSERLYQNHPKIAAHPTAGWFSVLGHSQDRLAWRRVRPAPRSGEGLGPVRAVSTWPLERPSNAWTAGVEPTRGNTLVVWTERSFGYSEQPLLAQGFSASGRRLGPPLELDPAAALGSVRVAYLPWKRRWMVAWSGGDGIRTRLVSRNARSLGEPRRAAVPQGQTSVFDLAVDPVERRVLVVGPGRPADNNRHWPSLLMVRYLDARGRRAAGEVSLGRYLRQPAVAYDPRRGRFLLAWEDERMIRGVFLSGRRPSDRFVLYNDGWARFVELAYSPAADHFLLTWRIPEARIDGGGLRAVLAGRWYDGEGEAASATEALGLLDSIQDLAAEYMECAADRCLVAWEASRGLDTGSFLDRHAIVGRFLEPPG